MTCSIDSRSIDLSLREAELGHNSGRDWRASAELKWGPWAEGVGPSWGWSGQLKPHGGPWALRARSPMGDSMWPTFLLACQEEMAGGRNQKHFYPGDSGHTLGKDRVRGGLWISRFLGHSGGRTVPKGTAISGRCLCLSADSSPC